MDYQSLKVRFEIGRLMSGMPVKRVAPEHEGNVPLMHEINAALDAATRLQTAADEFEAWATWQRDSADDRASAASAGGDTEDFYDATTTRLTIDNILAKFRALRRSAETTETATCAWTIDGHGIWMTSCGHSCVHGGQKFCGYCGKTLSETKSGDTP